MRVQVKTPLNSEINHLLDPIGFRRLPVYMEFADTAVVAARVLALDQFEDRRMRPDARHDF